MTQSTFDITPLQMHSPLQRLNEKIIESQEFDLDENNYSDVMLDRWRNFNKKILLPGDFQDSLDFMHGIETGCVNQAEYSQHNYIKLLELENHTKRINYLDKT